MNSVELFGTISSIIIAVSLMQKNIKLFRFLNLLGALGFSIYGLFINSIPVVAVNFFITLIDIYFIVKEQNKAEKFDYLKITGDHSDYLNLFFDFHKNDILKFIPDAIIPPPEDAETAVILRDAVPVALICYKERKDQSREMLIDYSIPSHRDRKNTKFFFDYIAKQKGSEKCHTYSSKPGSAMHEKYLKSMGFVKESQDKYIKKV